MRDVPDAKELPEPAPAQPPPWRRSPLGFGLIVLGLLVIVVAVLYVLEVANGPGTGPKAFAERRSYDQVKVAVHESFPAAFAVALGGLGCVFVGMRLLTGSSTSTGSGGAGPTAGS